MAVRKLKPVEALDGSYAGTALGFFDDLTAKCGNAEPGTFSHECEKPAEWIGFKANGHKGYFCDHCKNYGWERNSYSNWHRVSEGVSNA